ncbi:phosphatidylinositol synthase [Ochromonadaceae sp. CCMP2298]|nr:phosphatidylinositol synthase [Ochromonadaceae sp. CCMP2298]|mmetsp:Transcript_4539/g.10223  ORF Transcript_4539/g.10223 Transcript_4539/m.10223 type:complete len:227 (-) Transcript_4539:85-765(-)
MEVSIIQAQSATPSHNQRNLSMPASSSTEVLLYYPNMIGYARFAFMLASFYFAHTSWKLSIACYCAAFAGDVVDGYVARAFNQCSKFGGILDMVTDRVSTCGLLVVLAQFYPAYSFAFTSLIVLDITSHWFHVMSVTAHHKSTEALVERNALLRWYYSIYPLFGYCCVGTEFYYIALYIYHFSPEPIVYQIMVYGCLPACILKQIVNVIQLTSAADALAEMDVKKE